MGHERPTEYAPVFDAIRNSRIAKLYAVLGIYWAGFFVSADRTREYDQPVPSLAVSVDETAVDDLRFGRPDLGEWGEAEDLRASVNWEVANLEALYGPARNREVPGFLFNGDLASSYLMERGTDALRATVTRKVESERKIDMFLVEQAERSAGKRIDDAKTPEERMPILERVHETGSAFTRWTEYPLIFNRPQQTLPPELANFSVEDISYLISLQQSVTEYDRLANELARRIYYPESVEGIEWPYETEKFHRASKLALEYWKELGYDPPCNNNFEVVLNSVLLSDKGSQSSSAAAEAGSCKVTVRKLFGEASDVADLASLLAHEYGHLLGFKHSDDPESIMHNDGESEGEEPPAEATVERLDSLVFERPSVTVTLIKPGKKKVVID